MRILTTAIVLTLLAVSAPAFAGAMGLPTKSFAKTWVALPTGHFIPVEGKVGPVREFASLAGTDQPAVDRLVGDAVTSAADNRDRRDIALYEMATNWDQPQRTALDRLRMAEESYADIDDSRTERFVALLSHVGDPATGRSVAVANGQDPDEALTAAYATALAKQDDDTGRTRIETSQNAWLAYREAFVDFAREKGADAASAVKDELTRNRTAELAR